MSKKAGGVSSAADPRANGSNVRSLATSSMLIPQHLERPLESSGPTYAVVTRLGWCASAPLCAQKRAKPRSRRQTHSAVKSSRRSGRASPRPGDKRHAGLIVADVLGGALGGKASGGQQLHHVGFAVVREPEAGAQPPVVGEHRAHEAAERGEQKAVRGAKA